MTLRKLAASYGVHTSYIDVHRKRVESNPESVLAVLQSLGAPLERIDDAGDALRARRLALTQVVLPPVIALWDDGVDGIQMTLPAELGSRSLEASLHLENGDVRDWSPSARTVLRARSVEGTTFITVRLPLPSLPHGYHRLSVSIGGSVGGSLHESFIVRAPTRSFRDPTVAKRWGLFAPLFALHSRDSDGIGNFSDLDKLMRLTQHHGGAFVSTLPFLATFPNEPSPYSPVSRLFWNELYVDRAHTKKSPPTTPLDYQALDASHRRRLARIERNTDPDAIEAFQQRFPLVLDYARFRAATTQHGLPWNRWPEPHRSGLLEEQDVDADEVLYHINSQRIAEEQIAALSHREVDLYLDLPLGVHRDGYDTWREQGLFAHDMAVGAPPDAAFPGGQNWSTPPVLPHKSRLQGHRYLRLALRHAMRHAAALRVDHVMGLHRQFWIPNGADVADGVYVRYPADELYAILTLESHRARCELIGENLGIVPDVVNETMARHGLRGLYVWQLTPDAPIARDSIASLNTHDTPTFAAFTDGDERALDKSLSRLMRSSADLVSVAVEDLWLEPEPVNVPGTTDEHPNWRRPMRYSIEELESRIGPRLDSFRRRPR